MKQHRDVSLRIVSDVHRLKRACNETMAAHDRSAVRYHHECSEAENLASQCFQSVSLRPAERMKVAMRAVKNSREARLAETEYYMNIEAANRAQAVCEQHMPVLMTALLDMQEKQLRCLRDSLMKLAVNEASWWRNLQYDLDKAMKATQAADPAADLEKSAKPSSAPSVAPLGARAFWELGPPRPPPQMTQALKTRLEGEAFVSQQIELLQPLFVVILGEDSSVNLTADMKVHFAQLVEDMGNICRRSALCQVLKTVVISRSPPNTELDSLSAVSISHAKFDLLVRIFNTALDNCDQQNDAWNGRDLMVLAQIIRSTNEEKMVSLRSQVYAHPIWSKVTFWEEVLLIGICEAHSCETLHRRSLVAGTAFTDVTTTLFLQKFIEHMTAFGIKPDRARDFIQGTLRKQSPLLGSTTDKYVSKMLPVETANITSMGLSSSCSAFTPRTLSGSPDQPSENCSTGDGALDNSDSLFEAVALGVEGEFAGGVPVQEVIVQGDDATCGFGQISESVESTEDRGKESTTPSDNADAAQEEASGFET